MRPIRLYIQVLPWQKSSLPHGYQQNTRPEVILPWIEPCTEDISLQELSERIVSRFASIHRGKGCVFWIHCSRIPSIPLTNSLTPSISALNIECLQNYWGYVLDMPLTVGEVFDDLPGNTDISRSVVKVVRSPPTPGELENPLRSVSLVPESSARPQKRRLTQLAAASWDNQHRGENAQCWVSDGRINDDGRASKRRKIQNLIPHTSLGSDRPTFPSEGLQDGVYNSSQDSVGRLSPNRQIVDSPRPSSRKRMYAISGRLYRADGTAEDNSYGTPTSLSINSPPRIESSKLYSPIAIPDSPTHRETSPIYGNIMHSTDFELHAPRPESPELGSTNSRGSLAGSGTQSAAWVQPKVQALQGPVASPLPTPGPLTNGSDRLDDQSTVSGMQDAREDKGAQSKPSSSSSAERSLLPNHSFAPTPREPNGTNLGLRDIIEPIDRDRDSEKSNELPKLPSNKQANSESLAPKIHNLDGHEHGERNEKAMANTMKTTLTVAETGGERNLTPNTQNTKPATRISRSDSGAAAESPKRTGDEVSIKEKAEEMHPPEGGAQELQAEHQDSKNMRLAEEAERVRLAEEKGARDIEPIEVATIVKRPDGIAKKTDLCDKGAKKAKLVEEASIVRPTRRKLTKAILAEGEAAEAASMETNAGSGMVETPIEAAKQVEGNAQESPVVMRKTKLAMLAEEKKPVKIAKQSQVRDRLRKTNVKRREESEEKTLKESKESAPLRQKEKLQNENPPAASGSVSIFDSEEGSEHITESKNLENARVPLETINPRTNSFETQKAPKTRNSSDAQSQNYIKPLSTRIEPDRMRESMTPPYPSSLVRKPWLRSSVPSHGTPLPKPLDSDRLPKSAIKQTSSSCRHSVSFAEDSTAISDSQRRIAPSDSKNSKRGTNYAIKAVKIENTNETLAESQAPKDILEVSQAPTTKDAKKEKTQSKLKIQRDVKLKGRVIDPPVPPRAATPEAIVVSSDSEYSVSSFYSEDDLETRNAKPDPSKSRQLTARVKSSKEVTRLKVEPNSVPATKLTKVEVMQPSTRSPKIDPPEEKPPVTSAVVSTVENNTAGARVHKPNMEYSSTPVQNIDPKILSFVSSSERSSPRAPAQYMSRDCSISSNSTSNVSGSDSDENNRSPSVETKRQPAREETRPDRIVRDTIADVEMLHAKSISSNGSQSSSRSSKAQSVSSRSSGSKSGSNSKRVEHAAEEQLQRESLQSMEPSQALRPAPLISRSIANKKHARPTLFGLPPTNSDFPRMTDLMKKQSAVATSGSGNRRSSSLLPSKTDPTKRATLSPFRVSDSSSSGSLSDDEGT